ncbi:MAG: GNAT family N-acetyltransferase [Azoarcus sp.]|jgi:ribosomal protein S18 acetylase RimI-like enzyme|nr:GNAT family N-acetyltransferase [Azoarcus sp.]
MTLDIDIRPIAPDEAPAIAALAGVVWLDAYSGILSRAQIDYMLARRYDHARLRAECGDPAKWLRQAFAGDFRAGFAACEICGGAFKLDKLYVHPAMQRRGVGAALVAHAAALARGAGYSAMILAVNKNNAQALRAYAKYGFRVREAAVTDIGGGFEMDDYIMEKTLDP